ncbi:FAR1-related protein, partial [Sesbania bispinosa]
PQMQRFDDLCKKFYEVGEVAAEYEDTTTFLQELLHEAMSKLKVMIASNKQNQICIDRPTCNVNVICDTPTVSETIHSPKEVRRVGRPASKRKVSILEKAIKSSKNRRKTMKSNQMQQQMGVNVGEECHGQIVSTDGSFVSLLSSFQGSGVGALTNYFPEP